MRRGVVLGALSGAFVPPLFVITTGALTITERPFLSKAGWSAVHRTSVEWPSLLALGPYGGVLEGAFVLCGALVVLFGASVAFSSTHGRIRFAGCSIVIAGLALALEAFKADPPGTTTSSWHDVIHNSVYPLIPFGAVIAAGALSFGTAGSSWTLTRRWSLPALAIFIIALVATNFGGIAQMARYFLFGAMLVWLEVIALDRIRLARSQTAPDSDN